MSAPLGNTPRIQAIRDGMAAGRDMGIFAELITVVDAVGQGLVNLQQAMGAMSQRVSALEAVGHLQREASVEAIAEVAADGLIDAAVSAPEFAVDIQSDGVVDEFTTGQTFGATVEVSGEVGTSGTP